MKDKSAEEIKVRAARIIESFYSEAEGNVRLDNYYHHIFLGERIDIKDGLDDGANYAWFMVSERGDLYQAIDLCCRFWEERCSPKEGEAWEINIERQAWRRAGFRMRCYLRILDDALLDSSWVPRKLLIEKCKKAGVNLICDVAPGSFYNYTDGKYYQEIYDTYLDNEDALDDEEEMDAKKARQLCVIRYIGGCNLD